MTTLIILAVLIIGILVGVLGAVVWFYWQMKDMWNF